MSKDFSNKLTAQVLIFALNLAFDPLGITSTITRLVYPIPALWILTLLICPSFITGTNFAYFPAPSVSNYNDGGELYPNPSLTTKTSTSFPLLITGVTWAPVPVLVVTRGCLS